MHRQYYKRLHNAHLMSLHLVKDNKGSVYSGTR